MLQEIADMLSNYRFRFVSEKDLQDGIEAALIKAEIPHKREFALSAPDRPDFMVEGGIAIEVKIKGSIADLLRQVSRYASHQEVTGILVIGTPHWVSRIPSHLAGKPVHSLRLIASLL